MPHFEIGFTYPNTAAGPIQIQAEFPQYTDTMVHFQRRSTEEDRKTGASPPFVPVLTLPLNVVLYIRDVPGPTGTAQSN